MSRAWMPIYWGDYLRDTRDLTTLQHGAYLLLIAHYWQHESLPTDERQLAAITGLTLARWRDVSAPIAAKFQEGWRHGRIDKEIAVSEKKIAQKIIAGRKGGQKSGTARAVLKGQRILEAEAKRPLQHQLNHRSSKNEANGQAKMKQPRTNHKEDITTTSQDTAREASLKPVSVSPELAAIIRKAEPAAPGPSEQASDGLDIPDYLRRDADNHAPFMGPKN